MYSGFDTQFLVWQPKKKKHGVLLHAFVLKLQKVYLQDPCIIYIYTGASQ